MDKFFRAGICTKRSYAKTQGMQKRRYRLNEQGRPLDSGRALRCIGMEKRKKRMYGVFVFCSENAVFPNGAAQLLRCRYVPRRVMLHSTYCGASTALHLLQRTITSVTTAALHYHAFCYDSITSVTTTAVHLLHRIYRVTRTPQLEHLLRCTYLPCALHARHVTP